MNAVQGSEEFLKALTKKDYFRKSDAFGELQDNLGDDTTEVELVKLAGALRSVIEVQNLLEQEFENHYEIVKYIQVRFTTTTSPFQFGLFRE